MTSKDLKNIKFDLALIVTCIDEKYILKMISSVISNNNQLNVLIIFVNQSGMSFAIENNNLMVHIIELKSKIISLSKARNIGINYLLENTVNFFHLMFPDDDSTFTKHFFKEYEKCVTINSNILINIYCEGTKRLYKKLNHNDGDILSCKNYDSAMSVNMIVSYDTFASAGLFDERLGVGSKYGSAEDNDYFINCCMIDNGFFVYKKNIYYFHPSPSNKYSQMSIQELINKFINYGNGIIFMLCKHKYYKEALVVCIRAIAGAFVSLVKFDFRLVLAFSVVFYTRIAMFFRCIVFSKEMYNHN